ncbi:MAG: hypothetical protein ABH952_00595 [Candidatus Omnitrophota bacterium]
MSKLKQHILFKIAAVILINVFLCLNIAWAAVGSLKGLHTHLSPALKAAGQNIALTVEAISILSQRYKHIKFIEAAEKKEGVLIKVRLNDELQCFLAYYREGGKVTIDIDRLQDLTPNTVMKEVEEARIWWYMREIERLVSGEEGVRLCSLFDRLKSVSPEESKNITAEISETVDAINVFKEIPYEKLAIAEILLLGDFLEQEDAPQYIEDSIQALLSGEYVPEFLLAGAASRLRTDLETIFEREFTPGDYMMYGFDIWNLVKQLKNNMELVRKYRPELAEFLEHTEVPVDAMPLGMGQRQRLPEAVGKFG